MNNFEIIIKNIIQVEIDYMEEMEHEEKLAVMALIQDEVDNEMATYNQKVSEVNKQIQDAVHDAEKIKKKLDRNKRKGIKNQIGVSQPTTTRKITLAVQSCTETEGHFGGGLGSNTDLSE